MFFLVILMIGKRFYIYECDMLQKTLVKSFFRIPLKTFLIEELSRKAFLAKSVVIRSIVKLVLNSNGILRPSSMVMSGYSDEWLKFEFL